ncbi:MAG: helix-turn-helix domain-containing protein [Actinomycetota bacterium]
MLTDMEGASELPENLATIEPAPNNPAAALRRAREEGGGTLSEASSWTRIQERHLRALESDAPLEEFPAPAYARFFLREYAEYLRLDPDPLLREFEARHPVVEEPPLEPLADKRGRPKVGWGVLMVLSAVAVSLVALLPPTFRPGEEETPPPSVAAATPAHDSVHDQGPDPLGRQPSGVRAALRLSQRSWVEAVADGEVLEASTLEPGAAVVYRARDLLELTLGNAGGVRLRVNGELVPTGGSGDVVSLDLRWHEGEVLTDRG